MKKNFKIFFDMDDTLANFKEGGKGKNSVEEMYKENFFKKLEPLPFLNEVNKIASLCPENIFVLSACIDSPYCKEEKIAWLKENLPGVTKENVIFTNYGENKVVYVKKFLNKYRLTKYDILVDDYSKNIEAWEKAGGTAIKFKNSFNTADPTKYKYIIRDFSDLLSLIEKIRKEQEIRYKTKRGKNVK